jgi:hypothetical protein
MQAPVVVASILRIGSIIIASSVALPLANATSETHKVSSAREHPVAIHATREPAVRLRKVRAMGDALVFERASTPMSSSTFELQALAMQPASSPFANQQSFEPRLEARAAPTAGEGARGLRLPEPGAWSAFISTLALVAFFFARHIA